MDGGSVEQIIAASVSFGFGWSPFPEPKLVKALGFPGPFVVLVYVSFIREILAQSPVIFLSATPASLSLVSLFVQRPPYPAPAGVTAGRKSMLSN